MNQVEEYLNNEIDNFPERASGADFYRWMNKIVDRFIPEYRAELVEALASWLRLRSEPKTMLAVALIDNKKLIELKTDLEELLKDVEEGRVFKSHYDRRIKDTLEKIREKS